MKELQQNLNFILQRNIDLRIAALLMWRMLKLFTFDKVLKMLM